MRVEREEWISPAVHLYQKTRFRYLPILWPFFFLEFILVFRFSFSSFLLSWPLNSPFFCVEDKLGKAAVQAVEMEDRGRPEAIAVSSPPTGGSRDASDLW